jgi:CheY-like chemotaxis protein
MADPLIGIADHDPVLIRLLDQVLRDAGFRTVQLPSGTSAHEEIRKQQPDLIVLDTWLESREAGWILFQTLRLDRETEDIPVLICSSDLEEYEKRAASLESHGRVGVLNKPFDIDMLVKRVHEMLAGEEVKMSKDGQRPEGGRGAL